MNRRGRNMLVVLVTTIAVIAAGIAVAIWYARYRVRIPKAPAGGIVREFSASRAIIAEMKLAQQPTLAELAGLLRAFAACGEVEGSGNIHPGNAREPVPFRITVRPGDTPENRTIEFATRNRQRPMVFVLQLHTADGTGEFELQGRFRQSDLAFLHVKLPLGLDFQGEADIQLAGTFAAGKINSVTRGSGRCLPAAVLQFGAFRIHSPGRFELKREEDTTPTLTFPDARWSIDDQEILSPTLLFGPRNTIHFTGSLRPLPPHHLSLPLPVAGQLDGGSGAWSFHAESRQTLDAGTPRLLARLTGIVVDGRGTAAGGVIGYSADAASLAVRPDSEATRLWSASDAVLRGENAFAISPDGLLVRRRAQYDLTVREISVAEGVRRWQAENLRLHWDSSAETPQEARFTLDAARFSLALPEEELGVTKLHLTGHAVFVREQLRRLAELRLTAEQLQLQAGGIRLEADNWEGAGEFDTAGEQVAEELTLNLQGRQLRFAGGALSGEAQQPTVAIRQRTPMGSDRAPVRSYRIAAGQLAVRREATGMVRSGKSVLDIRFDAGTGRWSLQRGEWEAPSGQIAMSGPAASALCGPWQFSAALFRWNDPEGFAVIEKGEGSNGVMRLQQLSGRLPLNDAVTGGELQIGVVRLPGRLVDTLTAELTRNHGLLSWKGRTHADALSGGGFFFRGGQSRAGYPGVSLTEFTLPPTSLRGEYPLAELAPGFPGKWRLLGKLGGEGTLQLAPDAPPRLRFQAEFTGDAVDRQTVLTRAEINLALPLTDASRTTVGGGRLDAPDFAATQFLIALQGTAPQQAEFSRWGGKWRLQSGDAATGRYVFQVRDLAPNELFQLPGWRGVLDTPLSGEIILALRAGKIRLVAAELQAGRPGKLRTASLEAYRYLEPDGKLHSVLTEFAAAAGKEFNFQTFRLQYAERDGQNRLRLTADGRAAGPLPFVYADGEFRKAGAAEYGFDSEVELRSDYRLPGAPPEERP